MEKEAHPSKLNKNIELNKCNAFRQWKYFFSQLSDGKEVLPLAEGFIFYLAVLNAWVTVKKSEECKNNCKQIQLHLSSSVLN